VNELFGRNAGLTFLFLVLLLCCTVAALGQDDEDEDRKPKVHPIDAKLEECLKTNKGAMLLAKCHSKAAEAWEKEVGKAYEERLKGASDDDKSVIKDSQDAWTKYREAERKMITGFYSKRRGTDDVSVRTIRLYEIDRKRALALDPKEFLKPPAFDDNFDQDKPVAHPIDINLKACLKVNRANMQRAQCHSKAARTWVKEVKRAYAGLYAVAGAKDKTNIKASQDAWEKYSEAEGSRVMTPYLRRRGTGYISVRIIILYEINRKRTLELERWRHDIYRR
jgi:uncharacterized protein YecT (DUF1311 family)